MSTPTIKISKVNLMALLVDASIFRELLGLVESEPYHECRKLFDKLSEAGPLTISAVYTPKAKKQPTKHVKGKT